MPIHLLTFKFSARGVSANSFVVWCLCSALDIGNEANVYSALQDSGLTYVSVGHRPSIAAFHSQVLSLSLDGSQVQTEVHDAINSSGTPDSGVIQGPPTWQLLDTEQYMAAIKN